MFALLALVASAITATPAGAQAPPPARFSVGTAVVDITPTRPQYLGGYDRMNTPTANVNDPLQVRAFFVARGRHAIAFVSVDTQGWFAGYQEGPYGVTDARQQAALWLAGRGYDVTPGDLIISSTHSHAAPTIMGIWGPTDPVYLREVHDAAIRAIEDAATHVQPAELWSASGSIDDIISQNSEGTDSFDGWAIDPTTPVLWARRPHTGATIGLYTNVPVHPDQFRGSKYRLMSADHPGVERALLDRALGGTAVVAMGTLGRQETQGGEDDYAEVQRQGRFIANGIERGLAHATPITDGHLAGAEQYITSPASNAPLMALLYANTQGFSCNDTIGACTIDRAITPPYLAGNLIGTWVTTIRIGNVVWSTEPGEAFPEVSAAIRGAVQGAGAVNIVGMAQDQLGYFYPPEDYPASELNPSDFILFNVGPGLADQTTDAAALNARALGLQGFPQHPMMADKNPQAYLGPGVQFWPGVVESDSPQVAFLVGGKPSNSPALPTTPGHTVSPAVVDFGDGSRTTVTGEQHISHTYAAPGHYSVSATVVDEQGQTRNWTREVIVDPPLSAADSVHRRSRGSALTAATRGGDGALIAAHWAFSDGTSADGLNVWRSAGQVLSGTVTVVDGAGDSASAAIAP